jgi:hypothetical protein
MKRVNEVGLGCATAWHLCRHVIIDQVRREAIQCKMEDVTAVPGRASLAGSEDAAHGRQTSVSRLHLVSNAQAEHYVNGLLIKQPTRLPRIARRSRQCAQRELYFSRALHSTEPAFASEQERRNEDAANDDSAPG